MKFTIAEIAKLTQSNVLGNPEHIISDIADLQSATEEDASFLSNPRYKKAMECSKAGVVFIKSKDLAIEGRNFLLHTDPSRAFQNLLEAFIKEQGSPSAFAGIHPTAVIHESAHIAPDVSVGPYAVIDENVRVNSGSFIGAHTFLGPRVSIGTDCHLHPHVTIRERCVIGNRVILQPGCVIGSCGFGYTNNEQGHYVKLEQTGNVVIEDDVEIGANSCVDRARFKSTRISRGSKIDNLVQIAHGVSLGPDNCFVAQCGIAGSASTGKRVLIAGQSGITGHVSIGDDVAIAGQSGVTKSLPKPGKYSGKPAIALNEYNQRQVLLRNIDQLNKRLKQLEERFL